MSAAHDLDVSDGAALLALLAAAAPAVPGQKREIGVIDEGELALGKWNLLQGVNLLVAS